MNSLGRKGTKSETENCMTLKTVELCGHRIFIKTRKFQGKWGKHEKGSMFKYSCAENTLSDFFNLLDDLGEHIYKTKMNYYAYS